MLWLRVRSCIALVTPPRKSTMVSKDGKTKTTKQKERPKRREREQKKACVLIVGMKLTTTKVSVPQMGEHATTARNKDTSPKMLQKIYERCREKTAK